jgi:hypothetical protein
MSQHARLCSALDHIDTLIVEKLLYDHRGKQRAIKRDSLRKYVQEFVADTLSDRELRKRVEHLIISHRIPIGTATCGYFFVDSEEDFLFASHELDSKIRMLSVRRNELGKAWQTRRDMPDTRRTQLMLF